MEFIKKYKVYIILAVVILILLVGGILLFTNNYSLRGEEKRVKVLLDSLHRDNELLINELQVNRDSIQYLHTLAINQNNRDTIFVNQIKYLKSQTNEQISHLNTLSTDSQYIVFSNLIEHYSQTGFTENKP